tara:strand:+ start:667 stop:879 length:213 start_codon:yes stop_codon:yes gene_type:complete
MSYIEVGTLVIDKDHGVCTVLSSRRTGHQYERYYEYEILTPSSGIITTDEYEFMSGNIQKVKDTYEKEEK